jgi:hypothetical protein
MAGFVVAHVVGASDTIGRYRGGTDLVCVCIEWRRVEISGDEGNSAGMC